jgi:isopentenyldiphosphate isomerase
MAYDKLNFEVPATLEQYMVNEETYLRDNPHHHVLVIGACIFNSEGRLLLIQRATDEPAFPGCWVRVIHH